MKTIEDWLRDMINAGLFNSIGDYDKVTPTNKESV